MQGLAHVEFIQRQAVQVSSAGMLAQLYPERAGKLRQGFEGKLQHWDVNYWAERLREARYQLTDEQLRPYFALPNVLDGLFQARARRPSSGATLTQAYGHAKCGAAFGRTGIRQKGFR